MAEKISFAVQNHFGVTYLKEAGKNRWTPTSEGNQISDNENRQRVVKSKWKSWEDNTNSELESGYRITTRDKSKMNIIEAPRSRHFWYFCFFFFFPLHKLQGRIIKMEKKVEWTRRRVVFVRFDCQNHWIDKLNTHRFHYRANLYLLSSELNYLLMGHVCRSVKNEIMYLFI